MAKGAQDWVARTDLLLQTLSELIVRYKYGACQTYQGSGPLWADTTYTLLSVSGKGIIYGGCLHTDGSSGSELDGIYLELDGVETYAQSIANLFAYAVFNTTQRPVYITKYDMVDYDFGVGIMPGITFETSFKLKYAVAGASISLFRELYYATI